MSNLEVAKVSSPMYSYQFSAMGAGTITTTDVRATFNASTLVNFYPAVSKIVGIVRVTAGGVPGGKVYCNVLSSPIDTTGTGYLPQLQLRSSLVGDTSVYAIYWVNEVVSSQLLTVVPC